MLLLCTAPPMEGRCEADQGMCIGGVMFGVAGMVRHGTRSVYTRHRICSYSVIHSGLDNGLNLSESTQYSKPMKQSSSNSSTAHRLLITH